MSGTSDDEKIFEHYLQFPAEVRTVVIEEMTPADRFRFTRCSRLSNKEVKSSKNVCYKLTFTAVSDYFARIEVRFDKIDDLGYVLIYQEEEENKKYMRYFDLDDVEFWAVELDTSTYLPLYAAEQFKQLLHLYQKKIKVLKIRGILLHNELKGYDFGIEHLDNLEIIELNGNEENLQCLMKLRRPLKELWVEYEENDQIVANYEEVYHVQRDLMVASSKFTNEQLLRISASDVLINIGDLTAVDIFHFIRSWQNETIGKKTKRFSWRIARDRNWDKTKLLRLLGVDPELDERGGFKIKIENFKQPRKSAKLEYLVLGDNSRFHSMILAVENII